MQTIDLAQSNWMLKAVSDTAQAPADLRDRDVPATVPGCVHTDLMATGLIPDLYQDINEPKLLWIGETDWQYRTTFRVDGTLLEHDRVDLACDGLDTVADVELNGQHVAHTESMHVGYRFNVKPLLQPGDNELVITFASPNRYARDMEAKLGPLPYVKQARGDDAIPFNFIRKMACNFGWDWGPVAATSGIWQPIRIEAWNGARLDAVRPLVVACEQNEAVLDVYVDLEGEGEIDVRLADPNGTEVGHTHLRGHASPARLKVKDPERWFPVGFGDQPLYTLTITANDQTITRRIGLRSVELDASEDNVGRRFVLKINGREVFCKGANWIPDDCFLNRASDPLRLRTRIQQAIDANMNMLRIWGGGIYETDTFYDICDELGVMVWQDFLFACAAYPEEEPFYSMIREEAEWNVKRLASHPSLVLWDGCNENVMGYQNWGWKDIEGFMDRTWGLGYYTKLLPGVLAELDPSRPYWPASPYSYPQGSDDQQRDPANDEVNPNSETHGNKHVWEAWFGEDYTVYRKLIPRFCSEFGFQAPATYATMAENYGEGGLTYDSDARRHRQKSPQGDVKNDEHIHRFFEFPDPKADYDDWHFLLQLNQARALTTGVEWFRSQAPRCMGTLYWQLNDCWPCTTWAAIDAGNQPHGRFKPLYFATRKFYAPRLLTIQPEGDALVAYAINDTDEPWADSIDFIRFAFAGEAMPIQTTKIQVPPRSVGSVSLQNVISNGPPIDTANECLVAAAAQSRAVWYHDFDKALNYPEPKVDAVLNGNALTLTARSFIRDLCIFVDRVDPKARISDQLVTLLPGEAVTFEIETDEALDVDALTAPPVMQCANRFGA